MTAPQASSNAPLLIRSKPRSDVNDPLHLLPHKGNETRWLQNCTRRVRSGYVHSVFCDAFVGCLFATAQGLAFRVTGRAAAFEVALDTPQAVTPSLVRSLLDSACSMARECKAAAVQEAA